jgi:hypothetical protein
MARPGLEPGTPRVSGSRGSPGSAAKDLQIFIFAPGKLARHTFGFGLASAGSGLCGRLEVPMSGQAWVATTAELEIGRQPPGCDGSAALRGHARQWCAAGSIAPFAAWSGIASEALFRPGVSVVCTCRASSHSRRSRYPPRESAEAAGRRRS